MAHYTTYTDGNYDLTLSCDAKGINININNIDFLNNPAEAVSITLNAFDIETLIEELEIYKESLINSEYKKD